MCNCAQKPAGLVKDQPGEPTPVPGPHGGKVTNPDKAAGCKCVTMTLCKCTGGDCSSCYCDSNPNCGCKK